MSVATLDRPVNSLRAAGAPGGGVMAAQRLIGEARSTLLEAVATGDDAERYAAAHLAALRTAAAVLADRARPSAAKSRRSRRPTSAWDLLCHTAPELAEWAAYFAAGAGKRAAAQAGLRGAVSSREADDLCREVGQFLSVVEAGLGMLPLDNSLRAAGETALVGPLR